MKYENMGNEIILSFNKDSFGNQKRVVFWWSSWKFFRLFIKFKYKGNADLTIVSIGTLKIWYYAS